MQQKHIAYHIHNFTFSSSNIKITERALFPPRVHPQPHLGVPAKVTCDRTENTASGGRYGYTEQVGAGPGSNQPQGTQGGVKQAAGKAGTAWPPAAGTAC